MTDVPRYEADLLADPALVGRILAELPPVETPGRVEIRTDAVSVDGAIAKALVFTASGVETRIELRKE